MISTGVAAVLLISVASVVLYSSAQAGQLTPDDPAALKQTRSLGKLIKDNPTKPVHIVFVHGIRTNGPGEAQQFMKGLCSHVRVVCPKRTGGPTPTSFRKAIRCFRWAPSRR